MPKRRGIEKKQCLNDAGCAFTSKGCPDRGAGSPKHGGGRAERGALAQEEHLSFEALERLLETLSPKRIELIRFVRHRPHLSIAALARELGRDHKRVHGDVRALERVGLLEQDEDGLRAPYAGVDAQLSF